MKVGILSSGGIGDGLLMMIAAHAAEKAGHSVTLFHEHAEIMRSLFPDQKIEAWPESFETYDLVVAENDNSEKMWDLMRARNRGKFPHLVIFFRTPNINALPCDYVFKRQAPMATSIAKASRDLFGLKEISKENGLSLATQKEKKQIAIHPTSKDPKRTWPREKFYQLAKKFQRDGFRVVFLVGPSEHAAWSDLEGLFSVPKCTTLSETAEYLAQSTYFVGNDSGIGHLASNLGLPTLTIAGNPKQIKYWRPDFSPGKVITIPFELPNFKGIGFPFRDRFWQYFVTVEQVYKAFKRLSHA